VSTSAGILVFRRNDGLEVLLAHPGGPFWAHKDDGSWSIPKGELDGENPLQAARREFEEETGEPLPDGELRPLGEIRQASGKVVHAWAVEGDLDATTLRSNLFEMEWPPRSGRTARFPEIDRFEWFDAENARRKINPAQREFIDRLEESL
jgi:predicted NUDIX family NTP pyrophosphohydrolase